MAKNKDVPASRLKNLDELLNLNDGVNPLEQSISLIEIQPNHKRTVTFIAIVKLIPFSGHPFRLYEGERLDDMVASIRVNGVLVPIIVRRLESIFEILAGHNRVNAAKLAGLEEVPAITLENVSDEDAMVYVIETNLIQRSFADMTHSEKAAVIALHHSKMFSQGKRNDILVQIKRLENPHEYKGEGTSAEIHKSEGTRESIASEYSLKPNRVALYLRIQQLIAPLKERLDKEEYALSVASYLSFLKESEQVLIADCMGHSNLSIDIKKANLLRQYSSKGKLNAESVFRILSGETKPKPNRTPTVKVSKAVYAKYFKPTQSEKEVQDIVEKALAMYFEQR